jgi:uroporphyrin-III C-methyltransferase
LPVAVIQSGTTKNEKVAIGVVDTIVEVVEEKNITSPALIVFGEVVSLHPEFQPIKEFYDIVAEG